MPFACTIGPHRSAVSLYDVLDQGQPQSEARVTSRDAVVLLPKSVEHVRQELGSDAHSRIAHGKLDVGLAKGKKQYDKRATIKEREWTREQQRLIRNRTGSARSPRGG